MRKQLAFLYVLLVLILLTGAGAVYYLYISSQDPYMEEYDYDEVQELVTVVPEPTSDPEEEEGPVIEYNAEELLEINEQFKGWLMIPDSVISLPVVQGTDNSFYLNHSFTKEYSVFGALFFDKNCSENSRSRVIHGHNMGIAREEMFSTLVNYQDQSYAEAHKIIYFSEPGVEGETWEVFSVLNFDTNRLDEFNYRRSDFDSDEDFAAFTAYLKGKSIYQTEYMPDGEDVIILSTCYKALGESNRLLICAAKTDGTNTPYQ